MGMSTHVVLLRSKDDPTYQKYLKVILACREAGVDYPPEVEEYWRGYDMDSDSLSELEGPLEIRFEPREWGDSYRSGYEIDLDELPPGVKTIRFYNSW
jgi:hypothetical protein